MSNLIIDPAAGLATKPRGADVSKINVFSLATAPRLGVKIVLHLIWMQFSGPASRLQRSASGFCSYHRHWPWQEALARASDRREVGPKPFLTGRTFSVRISLPLHHIFYQSRIRERASRWSSWWTGGSASQRVGHQSAEALLELAHRHGYLIWCHVINSCSLARVRP